MSVAGRRAQAAYAVKYSIVPADPGAHIFRVHCTVGRPDPTGQRFSLPVWIPGSYLVRDFARHVLTYEAASGGQPVAIAKTGKSEWACEPCAGPLTVTLTVYANDLSVRGAHLDTTHAYFNGTSVFLRASGHDAEPCRLSIEPPVDESGSGDYDNWRVATSLRRAGAGHGEFGDYEADDYDDLIDHPVEAGVFTRTQFTVCGVPHEICITGQHRADLDRLAADVSRICEYHIRFFGEPAPIDRYVFLVTAVGEGYGGLEHRYSSSLMCRRDELPTESTGQMSEPYRRFLGLVSHEYFHLWNVKRIRPAAFAKAGLNQEVPTSLLWVFEGITSYYDDLALVRSGLIDAAAYLELVGKTATRVFKSRGRQIQSLADSSFDAWIKLYKADENAPNAIVSYYTKGALAALALDQEIRDRTSEKLSLDDVMRELWQRHGDSGVAEDAFEQLAGEVTGLDLRAFFDAAIRGTEDIALGACLKRVGVCVSFTEGSENSGSDSPRASLDVNVKDVGGRAVLANVLAGGAAQQAGLSAEDELVALDSLKVTYANLAGLVGGYTPGELAAVSVFRRDELMEFDVTLQDAVKDTCLLTLDTDADESALAARDAWLTGRFAAR